TADVCLGGTCQHPAAPEGTACGSPASGECDQPDGCDGLGQCPPNHLHDGSACSADANPCTADVCVSGACAHPAEPAGTPCGDPTQDACTAPDACDGAGVCLAHHSADDTACVDDGNPCTADLCDRGRCEHPAMPIGTPCGDPAETA